MLHSSQLFYGNCEAGDHGRVTIFSYFAADPGDEHEKDEKKLQQYFMLNQG